MAEPAYSLCFMPCCVLTLCAGGGPLARHGGARLPVLPLGSALELLQQLAHPLRPRLHGTTVPLPVPAAVACRRGEEGSDDSRAVELFSWVGIAYGHPFTCMDLVYQPSHV